MSNRNRTKHTTQIAIRVPNDTLVYAREMSRKTGETLTHILLEDIERRRESEQRAATDENPFDQPLFG
jgi:hypothetical protein